MSRFAIGRNAWFALLFFATWRLTLGATSDPLVEGFRQPPESARPLVFWQWMNGCVTKEGITSDLESFQRVGLGGVQNFLVGGSEATVTDPEVQVLNPRWRELMRFAMDECARLGLSFGTHNCPGWSASGSPGVTPADAMKKLVWTTTDVEAGAQVELKSLPAPAADARYYRDVLALAVRTDTPIRPDEVQVLLDAESLDSRVSNWTAPAGRWRIYRFGETLTGSINGTAPLSGQGLEVDKLNRDALDRFWPTFPGQLVTLAGDHAGHTFKRLELDSYEAGVQEWTTDALREFKSRCGYDARPWLTVLTGETVMDAESSRRFREDWRFMVERLLTENYFGRLGDLIRRNPGMEFLLEPYATGKGELFSTSEVSAKADQLMCEFWWGPTTWGWDSIKPVASAVHTLGRRVALAEAFTGQPQYAWRVAPFDLKATGDRAFAKGVNRVVLHAAAHQPWPQLKPGMTMGWWGTQFGPGQTWWEHGGPEWITYLARCQFLLQQGIFVGDLAFLAHERITPTLPTGYDGDTLGESALIERIEVRDHRLVLPDGLSYRALILPEQPEMRLQVLEKLATLVEQGAVIAGPRPERLHGQREGPSGDERFQKLTDYLWGPREDLAWTERRVGLGRVLRDRDPQKVLSILQIVPDVEIGPGGTDVLWTHRRTPQEDIYFISNQGAAATVNFVFQNISPIMEIWHPDTGLVEPAGQFTLEENRTRVQLTLDRAGSCFVVFRQAPTQGRSELSLAHSQVLSRVEVQGEWQLKLPLNVDAPSHVTLAKLVSWSEYADEGVRHFSGTAIYSRPLDLSVGMLAKGRRVMLDLGNVQHVAEVRLNGVKYPALWKPPYRIDVTAAIHEGGNELEILVTNLWPNRLIGDAHEPEDTEWGAPQRFKYVESNPLIGRPLLKIPDWITRGTPRPSSKRVTFGTYDFFRGDEPLLPSGLLGPVVLESVNP